jgi:methylmalonyl-CoA mutase
LADERTWRAAAQKDLGGVAFDEALGSESAEGLRVDPVYFGPVHFGGGADDAVGITSAMTRAESPRICVRCDDVAQVREAIEGGADAVWLAPGVTADTGSCERVGDEGFVSSLAYHAAGADAADEIAALLSLGVAFLRGATRAPTLRVSVGRDTFGELCKLRALRLCWAKVLTAAGLPLSALRVHAVCATRTLAARDPWVNMLRTTTQVFAAILGSADLVTPQTFDAAIGAHTALGRRVARNTALVLREESQLGRVIDPAAGSYYLEHRTLALAQLAWQRFQILEREGGVGPAFDARVAEAWKKREALLARRKEAVLGVSEFANLDEERPASVSAVDLGHRDSEMFERLRDRAEQLPMPRVILRTLGPPAEHRARLGFAEGLFPVAGLRTELGSSGSVVCLCGSDERYAVEAADQARASKAAGAKRVLLAGRPGALEAALREAGVDDFVYVGCDVVLVLGGILEVLA